MKKDELRIRIIPDNGQILIETYTDGIVTCKEVQEDALLDCIKISQHQYLSSGFLPPDCFHVGIHPNEGKSYCLRYPRLYADISYHETPYPNFPLPRLVFAFRVDTDGKVSECRLGVTADERLTPETAMFRMSVAAMGAFVLAAIRCPSTKRRTRWQASRHFCCPFQTEITASTA